MIIISQADSVKNDPEAILERVKECKSRNFFNCMGVKRFIRVR